MRLPRQIVDRPLVSVLIVVFQDRDELSRVLESVLRNKSSQVEIVVVDGGSTDGTVGLLRSYGRAVDKWVSENDGGLYDGMNKGISMANGKFIYHLNAGDRLIHLPIADLQRAYDDGIDIMSFPVSVDGVSTFQPTCGWRLKHSNTLHHQGTFYRRSALPRYNLKYKVFADFDLNQRLALRGARIRLGQTVVAWFSSGGLSSQRQNGKELFKVIADNHGGFHVAVAYVQSKYDGLRSRLKRSVLLHRGG